jgi:Agrobacterium tumefaciens protein Atu4866
VAISRLPAVQAIGRLTTSQTRRELLMQTNPHIGMWITADSNIRHNLLPDNRYDEARGCRESAYQGRYEVTGNHIEYWDDTGFTADGDFIDGVLHHAGMILYRDGIRPPGA